MFWDDGSKYTGQWMDNKKHGNGTMEWYDGRVYKGEWIEGTQYGEGTLLYKDGSYYSGKWVNDTICGYGTMVRSDGETLRGEWDNEILQVGEVEYSTGHKKGQRYKGTFKSLLLSGEGNYFYPDGRNYTGEMNADHKNGNGNFRWLEGYQYIGKWTVGRIIGEGALILPNGTTISGEFSESHLDGKLFNGSKCCQSYDVDCILLYNDGALYHGECLGNQPHGYGRMISGDTILGDKIPGGIKYHGSWKNGLREGID